MDVKLKYWTLDIKNGVHHGYAKGEVWGAGPYELEQLAGVLLTLTSEQVVLKPGERLDFRDIELTRQSEQCMDGPCLTCPELIIGLQVRK